MADQVRAPVAGEPASGALHESYRRYTDAETFDVIVIGSGIGGLTAGALLAKRRGKRVLVLERHYTPGGFTHSFRRPGYDWDVGVHYIGEVHDPGSDMARLFEELTEGRLEWAFMGDVLETVMIGDRRYEFVSGREQWRARMCDYFPGQRPAIDRYLRTVEAAMRTLLPYFAEKAIPPFLGVPAGWALRRGFLRHSGRTTGQVLAEITRDPELAAVLDSQWGDYGLPPAESSFIMNAMVRNHYLNGGSYPVGGASRIFQAIAPVIRRAGGRILVGAEVAQVLVRDGRAVGVKMSDGREFHAPVVISDAGLANSVELLPAGVTAQAELAGVARRIPASLGHICLYVGLRQTDAELGLPRANLWVYPGNDFDGAVKAFRTSPDHPFPVVGFTFPSAKDPDFGRRHPGHATIDVISSAPFDWFRPWAELPWQKRGQAYDELKETLSKRLLEALYQAVPQVRGQVDYYELSTPLSTRHFMNYRQGEMYGLNHGPERFRERLLQPRTALKGFYLAGQDVVTAGVGGALVGGFLAASAVAGRLLLPPKERALE